MYDCRDQRDTDRVVMNCRTSEASGRNRGSWSQQRWVNTHKSSIKVGCVGRGGRLPSAMARAVAKDEPPGPNGNTPVKTCIDPKRR